MHRTIHIALPPENTDAAVKRLLALDGVIGLSLSKNSSIKPPGDVLIVNALNRGTGEILQIVEELVASENFSITTSESASLIDPAFKDSIRNDVDEALWEEIIAGLRHQGRISMNFILLMIAGGAICAVGLVSDPVPMMMAFAAAGIIAPGFEPVVAVPLGIVFKRFGIVGRALLSVVAGYAVLILAAAAVIKILLLTGNIEPNQLTENRDIETMINPTLKEMIVSGCGAAAGIIITAAYRRSVIAGALIALIIIPAAAVAGAGIAVSDAKLIFGGLIRFAIDVAFIVGLGIVIFALKQIFLHRRESMI